MFEQVTRLLCYFIYSKAFLYFEHEQKGMTKVHK